MLVRGSDILTVLSIDLDRCTRITPLFVAELAHKREGFPFYNPDGLGVVLVFETPVESYVMGNIRDNPGLPEGHPYPKQINAAIGGYMQFPNKNLIQSALDVIKNKLGINNERASVFLKNLYNKIENGEWENVVCVHTDKWVGRNGQTDTMCFITLVKKVACSVRYLEQIRQNLPSNYTIAKLDNIVESSLRSYMDTEAEKAENAYKKFGEEISVTFNDLAIVVLSNAGAL